MRDTLSAEEWYDLNRFTLQLRDFEPPVLSLYLPSYEIAEGGKILDEGEGITGLEGVREDISRRLRSMTRHAGSICFFGWSKGEENIVKQVRLSKEVPPLYVVHREPYLKPLKDILEIGYQALVVIMDHKRAKIEVYNGSDLVEEINVRAYIRGRHKKGGWSQKRFQENRGLQIRYFFDKVHRQLKGLERDGTELILLGGRGLAKTKFALIMDGTLTKKTEIVDGISFHTSRKEITKRVISILDRTRKATELILLADLAAPAKRGLVIASNEEIENKLKAGAVETLFVAADYYATSPEENALIRRIIGLAKRKGSTIEFITEVTARRRLQKFGDLVALLRYNA